MSKDNACFVQTVFFKEKTLLKQLMEKLKANKGISKKLYPFKKTSANVPLAAYRCNKIKK